MPKRIQRKRTKGWKMPPGCIYVGRPTKWGNPISEKEARREVAHAWEHDFSFDKGLARQMADSGWREVAVSRYEEYLLENKELMDDIGELRGRDLSCWCDEEEKYCHADILIKIANR